MSEIMTYPSSILHSGRFDWLVVARVYNNRRGGEYLTAIGMPNTLH